MKKKFVFAVLQIFIFTAMFSQDLNLKFYYDLDNDYSGYAFAQYLGNIADIDSEKLTKFQNLFPENIEKLTKNNIWLLKKALDEWDYEKDETYVVMCTNNPSASEVLFIFVVITDNGEFEWWARKLTEEDVETLNNQLGQE